MNRRANLDSFFNAQSKPNPTPTTLTLDQVNQVPSFRSQTYGILPGTQVYYISRNTAVYY